MFLDDDPRLAPLAKFTLEGSLTPGYGDHYLFFVGRDNVHGVLKYLLSQEKLSLKFSMFGYDDGELNDIIMGLLRNPDVRVQASLDSTQAAGKHEKVLLEADARLDSEAFANSFVICQSPHHAILHTKGGVCVGLGIGFEGSTNWSAAGEGIGSPTDKGYRAQSNTLLVTTNPVLISRFSANLDAEHANGLAQRTKREKLL